MTSSLQVPAEPLLQQYGEDARLCTCANDQLTLVFSQSHPFDLIELEQLLEAVGWSRRPARRVRKALSNSLLKVGLWRHDPRVPGLLDLLGVREMAFLRPPFGMWQFTPFIKAMAWGNK